MKEAPDNYSGNGARNDLNGNELTNYRKLVGSNKSQIRSFGWNMLQIRLFRLNILLSKEC